MIGYLEGLLNIANVFIAVFIVAYAIFFLRRTHSSHHRRPWEITIVAIIFFLAGEIFTVLAQFNIVYIYGLINVLKTLFIGLMLFTFSMNTELLHDQKDVCIQARKKPKK